MGLLDFTKSIGEKIFGSEDEAPEKITQHIEANNPGIDSLDISVKDAVATVSGVASSAASKEKAILMAGNIQGIERVVDNVTIHGSELSTSSEVPGQPVENTAPAATFYIVESGDSLWKIAEKQLGNGARHDEIFAANAEVIVDANKIYPGQKLRIPA
ncbi:LysM domain-containing protein [Sinobacterium caligoides]|uniref:LysM domain-containing protein n=1 Tax=Sinobacterium caligoides TaxID=933926 RepID=A0A3N2DXV5_9GAMM|nr:peptidoglycan-binding protein LysM [Sinobacterium caligoides]ROS04696.1 LysM domain-containing protein [Sinobacterium caligoides]